MTLFVVDIDATLADATERIKRAGLEPSRHERDLYKAWLEQMMNPEELKRDKPVVGMTALVNSVAFNRNNRVMFLTNREERWRKITQDWLYEHGFRYGVLNMRPNDNWDDNAELKERIISQWQASGGFDDVVVLDDDSDGKLEAVCDRRKWCFLKARSGGVLK